jgi:hypothetical protein
MRPLCRANKAVSGSITALVKGLRCTGRFSRGRTLLLIGAIAALCFSVGEGLRLTPLPVSALAESAPPEGRLKVAELREGRPHEYGPLDKPTQVQKRGKRQTPDCQCPPSQIVRSPTARLLHSSCPRPPVAVTTALLTAGPADRGPPPAA